MSNIVTGTVHDLRAKRLWPVPLLLVAVLAALPFVAVKKSDAPAVSSKPAATSSTAATTLADTEKPLVTLAALEATSDLDVFSAKNPFKPMPALRKPTERNLLSGSTLPGATETGGGGGGGPTGGGQQDGAPLLPGPPATGPGGTAAPQEFTYLVDLTFGLTSKLRRYKSFPRLGLLPSERTPLVVFLGVTSGGNNAVFLVDSTLEPTGEGTCRPSRKDCGVLYVEPGELEHLRAADGTTYALQIDQIRKVSLKAARRAARERARRSRLAGSSSDPVRRLVLPLLSDLQVGGEADPEPEPEPQPESKPEE
jgi:hypothetical protein